MDSLLLLTLTISLMFTGGQCYSESQSCSYVNGKTICTSEKSDGNVAGAASNAMTGQGGSYQDASAMTANLYTGQSSSSRTAMGNMQPGGMGPGAGAAAGAFPGGFPFAFGAPPTFGSGSGSSAGSSASHFANTGPSSTMFTSTSGSGGTGVSGAFAGSALGGFTGSGAFGGPAAGGFAGSGVFDGGFPPSFGVFPTFDYGSSVPSSASTSDLANTDRASTFITSGSDDKGASEITGVSSGGIVGSTGFGGSGVFVGGNPGGMFNPFQFVFGGGFPFGRR